MHIHSLLALTLAATTSALPSLPECLMNDESRSRACRAVGSVQSKPENFDGQKQQNRGGLQDQIEYADQQIGKEIECPECGKNIVGDLAQSGSIGHNNMVTGQGEQQLDMTNGKTHEEWIGMGQKQQDAMPHGQKSNFNIGQNQKRNQHFGQLFNGQSNTYGSMNMDTGKTQQDELIIKGQGMTQELYNSMGRIQQRDTTHNWGNQLYQDQNDQQEQFNKGTQHMNTGGSNTNGIIQDFNKGQGVQQLYNGQQMDNQLYKIGQNGILMTTAPNHQQEQFNKGQQTQQLYNGQQTHQQWNNGPNDILMTTHQFYQGQPINTQQLNKGQGIQQLNKGQGIQQLHNGQQVDNQLYKTGQNSILMTTAPNHQQEQFNKGQQTQQLYNGQQTHQQWNNGPNDILMTTHQFYQGQPINTQQLNKGQGIQQLNKGQGIQQLHNGQQVDNQLYKTGQNSILMTTNPNHQQEQFNKGHQTQEMFKSGNNNGIQARHEITQTGIAEHFDGLNKQGQEMFDDKQGQSEQFTDKTTGQERFSGNAQSKPTEEWINNGEQQSQIAGGQNKQGQELIDGQNKQGQELIDGQNKQGQELIDGQNKQGQQMNIITGQGKTQEQWTKDGNQQELLVFTPQQMLNFVTGQAKAGQQWVREQIVQNGKQQAVWTCDSC
ncbi:hypothetical protein QBC32DRAFT_139384 [Pseudoneurospora amorphoporcata]|uniref:Uncharacterized protein n=1 Tax=Pseudoneurospora amorphoporcata TaxID=241081 RepID=A0AAN6NZ35_9PEZI|nr:hypothetical protein QBC32DRAFT_139384 [Pseudoneurospora amorphoporcata]